MSPTLYIIWVQPSISQHCPVGPKNTLPHSTPKFRRVTLKAVMGGEVGGRGVGEKDELEQPIVEFRAFSIWSMTKMDQNRGFSKIH